MTSIDPTRCPWAYRDRELKGLRRCGLHDQHQGGHGPGSLSEADDRISDRSSEEPGCLVSMLRWLACAVLVVAVLWLVSEVFTVNDVSGGGCADLGAFGC